MNEIPTEKLLPQGLQDMLSAQRECMAQANDINNEIINSYDNRDKVQHRRQGVGNGCRTAKAMPYWKN